MEHDAIDNYYYLADYAKRLRLRTLYKVDHPSWYHMVLTLTGVHRIALYRQADPVLGSTSRPDTGSCPRILNRIEPVDMAQGLGCRPFCTVSISGPCARWDQRVLYSIRQNGLTQGVLHRGGPNVIVQLSVCTYRSKACNGVFTSLEHIGNIVS